MMQLGIRQNPAIFGFIALLGSAALGAAGLALIASNRWSIFESDAATKFLLILQWQAVGVLLCKGGADQLIFSRVSHNPEVSFDIGALIWRFAIPAAFFYSCILSWLFSLSVATACFFCIVFDVGSVLMAADANGRRQHVR